MSGRRWSGRCPRWVMAAGALAGAAGVAAAGLSWTRLADWHPAAARRVTALMPTTTSSPPSVVGQRYDAGVVDPCALVEVTPLADPGFVVREAVPLTFSASSSCRMVLRLADAPSLDPGGDVDTSRELIAIAVDATSFPDDPSQAEWTWRTRRDFMTRQTGGQRVHDVVGLGSQAFSTSERHPANRRGRAAWSYGPHLWEATCCCP